MADLFNQDLFLDLFIALFALLNPLFAIPVFLGLTGDFTAHQRQRTAAVAAMTTLVALIVAALIGDQILDLFGVHIPAFQIAGGLIVLTIALGMLKGEPEESAEAKAAMDSKVGGASEKSVAVYPLAIPLLAGPGVFVTTIVFSSRVDSVGDIMTLSITIGAIVLLLWLSMAFATSAARFLNKTAISIGTKILGILLAAVSVEMIISGIDAHFLPWFTQS